MIARLPPNPIIVRNLNRSPIVRSRTNQRQIIIRRSRHHARHPRSVPLLLRRASGSHSAVHLRRKRIQRSHSRIRNLLRTRRSQINHRVIEGLQDTLTLI